MRRKGRHLRNLETVFLDPLIPLKAEDNLARNKEIDNSPRFRISTNVRLIRKKSGMEAVAFADKYKIFNLPEIELCRPDWKPTLEEITELAKALKVDIIDLLKKRKGQIMV